MERWLDSNTTPSQFIRDQRRLLGLIDAQADASEETSVKEVCAALGQPPPREQQLSIALVKLFHWHLNNNTKLAQDSSS